MDEGNHGSQVYMSWLLCFAVCSNILLLYTVVSYYYTINSIWPLSYQHERDYGTTELLILVNIQMRSAFVDRITYEINPKKNIYQVLFLNANIFPPWTFYIYQNISSLYLFKNILFLIITTLGKVHDRLTAMQCTWNWQVNTEGKHLFAEGLTTHREVSSVFGVHRF